MIATKGDDKMERLTMRKAGYVFVDCNACPKRGQCSDAIDCVDVLAEKLAYYEDMHDGE